MNVTMTQYNIMIIIMCIIGLSMVIAPRTYLKIEKKLRYIDKEPSLFLITLCRILGIVLIAIAFFILTYLQGERGM